MNIDELLKKEYFYSGMCILTALFRMINLFCASIRAHEKGAVSGEPRLCFKGIVCEPALTCQTGF
jgi:hypothetical protein